MTINNSKVRIGDVPPAYPVAGMLWLNVTKGIWYIFDGEKWEMEAEIIKTCVEDVDTPEQAYDRAMGIL